MVELQADAYYYKIQNCNDIDQLEDDLPSKAIPQFALIMEKIIEKLEDDLTSLYELWQENTSDEKEIILEINNLTNKIEICKKYLKPSEKNTNHIIFALSPAEQILPLSDIESIEKDYYSVVLKLLDNLQQELRTKNPTKQKVLTNNKTIKGVKEVKDYQTRVLYKRVKDNIAYVFLIMIKKYDWSKKDDNKVETRLKNVQKDYDYILSLDDEALEKELQKHQIYYDELVSILNPKQTAHKSLAPFNLEKSKKEKEQRFDRTKQFQSLPSEWQKYYIMAKKLKRDNGTINVKTTYIYRDLAIGKWLKKQKDAYDRQELTEYQIALLEELGIKWHQEIEILTLEKEIEKPKTSTQRLGNIPIVKNKLAIRWQEKYALAKQFYETYQHLKIPQSYTVNRVNLGTWINTQRQRYKKGKMPLEQVKLLESIGMVWEIYKPRANKKLEVIADIYRKLYNMTEDEIEEFILRVENDTEGLNQIRHK